MDIPITCPCFERSKVPAHLAGDKVRCEGCGRLVKVPDPFPEFADLGFDLDGATPVEKPARDLVIEWLEGLSDADRIEE